MYVVLSSFSSVHSGLFLGRQGASGSRLLQNIMHNVLDLLPDVTTRRVLATPAHGGPRETKALMYLSFQACGC